MGAIYTGEYFQAERRMLQLHLASLGQMQVMPSSVFGVGLSLAGFPLYIICHLEARQTDELFRAKIVSDKSGPDGKCKCSIVCLSWTLLGAGCPVVNVNGPVVFHGQSFRLQ